MNRANNANALIFLNNYNLLRLLTVLLLDDFVQLPDPPDKSVKLQRSTVGDRDFRHPQPHVQPSPPAARGGFMAVEC